MQLLDGQRHRRYFLHELGADLIRNGSAAGTGHEHAGVVLADAGLGLHAPQKFEAFLRLLGLMPLVVLPQDLVAGRIHYDRFHRGGAHIEPHHKFRRVIVHSVLLTGLAGSRSVGFKTGSEMLATQSPLAAAGTAIPGTRERFQKRVLLSIRSLTCSTNCAAVPAIPSRCGTR